MKTTLIALILSTLAAPVGAWTEWSRKYDEDKPIAGERDYILRIFDFSARVEQTLSRDLIEDYTTAILIPACASSVRLLRQGRDSELMMAYFRMLQATRNSASESFSFHLGEIYVANPGLVESVYQRLAPEDRALAFAKLDWGFQNVIYGKKVTPEIERLRKRLEGMKPAASGAKSSNQAMQLTPSKLAIYASGVCHPRVGSVASSIGLAAADLVSR